MGVEISGSNTQHLSQGSVYTRVIRIIGSALRHRHLPHASWLDGEGVCMTCECLLSYRFVGAKIVYPEQEVEDVKVRKCCCAGHLHR